jgi:hypothetical protein
MAADLGPLPPTKVHCTALVENALREALGGENPPVNTPAEAPNSNLMTDITESSRNGGGVKLVFLDENE